MRIGDIEITPLVDGEVVVPATTFYPHQTEADWEPYEYLLEPVMGELLHLNTLGGYLVRTPDRLVVVDVGVGPQPKFPFVGGGFRSALAAAGIERREVTDVVLTHLHFDHLGWASVDGKPFFPNATYRLDQRDWDFYSAPDFELSEVEKLYCYPELDAPAIRLAPVVDQMELFCGEAELVPGIVALEASGHTPGSTLLELTSHGETGLLLGDLVHAQPELLSDDGSDHWDFANHSDHDMAHAAVERFRKRIIDEHLPVAGAHFPGLRWGQVTRRADRYIWEDIRPQ